MICSASNLIVILFTLHPFIICGIFAKTNSTILTAEKSVYVRDASRNEPAIFCHKAEPKQVSSMWQTISISINLNDDNYEKFEGSTPEEVMENFKLHQSSWSPSILPFWKRRDIKIDPFSSTCVGIQTSKPYEIIMNVNYVDNWLLFKFIIGVVLFLNASKLSDNQLFYYICGITFGICGSLVIVIYLFSRLLPNRPMMYGMAIGGWTLSVYFLQYLLENVKMIILDYYQYVFGYIGISGLISFAICYRLGPLTNPRSKKLIQWSLQGAGLLLIFYSSYMYELTYPIDLILLLSRITPFSFFFTAAKYLKSKLFRPRVKLLTKKEFAEQGRKETIKALEELRGYCSSPECKPWNTVLKLKNPVRFAEFMEGSFHVSDDELEEYESLSIKPNGTIITDDSDDVTEYTEED
ncbi:nuclear envelope integral membrane protein [Planococcus citri]|uniref:nuclear envelope integral membrane protein n=1 Tax=Planococcus citri TaxID=170843 RepID=UPI0031F79D29